MLCFGSNNIKQLSERVGTPEVELAARCYSAILPDWVRVYNGIGPRWGNNSVANIVPKKGAKVFGLAVYMTQREIAALDPYEGHPTWYLRSDLPLEITGWGSKKPIVVDG